MLKKRKKDKEKRGETDILLEELEYIKGELIRYENLLNLTENDDLMEAYIFEYKALKIRCGYLIKNARDKNIVVDYIERCF